MRNPTRRGATRPRPMPIPKPRHRYVLRIAVETSDEVTKKALRKHWEEFWLPASPDEGMLGEIMAKGGFATIKSAKVSAVDIQ